MGFVAADLEWLNARGRRFRCSTQRRSVSGLVARPRRFSGVSAMCQTGSFGSTRGARAVIVGVRRLELSRCRGVESERYGQAPAGRIGHDVRGRARGIVVRVRATAVRTESPPARGFRGANHAVYSLRLDRLWQLSLVDVVGDASITIRSWRYRTWGSVAGYSVRHATDFGQSGF